MLSKPGALSFLLLIFLSGCDGGSSGQSTPTPDTSAANPGTTKGVLVDGVVTGARYDAGNGVAGVTDEDGVFEFFAGQPVSFYIGELLLGSGVPVEKPASLSDLKAEFIVTPIELAGENAKLDDSETLNIARLLLALDDDSNPDNGIVLSESINAKTQGIDPIQFALEESVEATIKILTDQSGQSTPIPSTEAAKEHLCLSIEDESCNPGPVAGVTTAGETTAGETTAGGTTAGGTTAGGTTAGDTTAGDTTAGDTTAGDTTAGETTAGDTIAGDTTAGDTTAGDTTAGDTTAGDTTAGDTSAGDTTAGDTTAGDTTAGDTTAGDTTAGDTTAGDTTAGDTSSGQTTDGTTTPINRAPVITGTPASLVNARSEYLFTPSATDEDNDILVFSITGKPVWAEFDENSGSLTGTPTNTDARRYENIVVSVSDRQNMAALAAFDIEVQFVNTPPVISGTPQTRVTAGSLYDFTPTVVDADGDSMVFTLSGAPGWVNVNAATGQLTGTPQNTDVGIVENVALTVTDGIDTVALEPFSIEVQFNNTAPTISGTPVTVAYTGVAYEFAPMGSDVDDQSLSWSITAKPDWAVFDTGTGVLSGTPGEAAVGTSLPIVIEISDGEFSTALPEFNIEVRQSNRSPSLSGVPATSVLVGDGYDFLPLATDPDLDNLTFNIANKPVWALFDNSTGNLRGNPAATDLGGSGPYRDLRYGW